MSSHVVPTSTTAPTAIITPATSTATNSSTASCRLCLSPQAALPHYDLHVDQDRAELIGLLLELETKLEDSALQPQFMCSICSDKIFSFLELREMAKANERIILKHQLAIVEKGLAEVLRSLEALDHHIDESSPLSDHINSNDGDTSPVNNSHPQPGEASKLNYACNVCNMTFHSEPDLGRHCERLHSDLSSVCIDRKSTISRREQRISCDQCDAVFKRKQNLQKHMRQVHEGQMEQCQLCPRQVKDLAYHHRTVHQNVVFNCHCGKSYTSKNALIYHEQNVHRPSAKQVCHLCAAELSASSLKLHMKLKHSGEVQKTIKCRQLECSKYFRTKQQEKLHYNTIHLNVKEECGICGGRFKNLAAHTKEIHLKGRQHTCDQCGKGFTKNNDLKLHKERIHLAKRYVCPVCGKKLSKIQEHMKRAHQKAQVKLSDLQVASSHPILHDAVECEIEPVEAGQDTPNGGSLETRIISLPLAVEVKEDVMVLPVFFN